MDTRSNFHWAAIGTIMLALGCSTSTQPSPFAGEELDLKIRQAFFAGFAGDQAALQSGMESCEAILAKNPRDAEAMVWHGAGVYYRSGLAFRDGDPVKGRQLFDQGISQMNEAVGLNPENLFVRVPRGAVLLTGTRFMADQRMARPYIEMGLGDYQKAYDFQQPTLDRLGVHPRGELIFGMAEASSRLGRPEKAEPLFRQLAVSLPGTEYAARAALWFQNRSLPVERTGCVGCHFEPGR